MSLVKPFDPDDIINAISGMPQKPQITDEALSAREIFKNEGADIQAAARAAYTILLTAEKESDRLNAAKLILQIQGAGVEDPKKAAGITLNIFSSGGTQQNLVNLIMPSN